MKRGSYKLFLTLFFYVIAIIIFSFNSYAEKVYLNDTTEYTINVASPKLFELSSNLNLNDNINHTFEGKHDADIVQYRVQYSASNLTGFLLDLLIKGQSGTANDEIERYKCDGSSPTDVCTSGCGGNEFKNFHNFSVVFDASASNAKIFVDGVQRGTAALCMNFTEIGGINVTGAVSQATIKNNLVTANNQPPTFVGNTPNQLGIPNQTWPEDTSTDFNISGNFSDSNNDALVYTYTDVNNITISINNDTGIVNLTPDPDFFGVRYVIFTADDSTNTTTSNNVTLNVTNVNDPLNVNILGPEETLFDFSSDINITVNVTAKGQVDSVLANVSWSNRYFVLSLLNTQGSIYHNNFTNTTLGGIYNITILANDTAGNFNNSVKTSFNITSGAFIETDSSIYSPSATITITGIRFTENVNVTLNIVNSSGNSISGFPLNVTTNEFGSFQNTTTAPTVGNYTIFANDTTNSFITANTTFEVKEVEGITFQVLNATGNNLDAQIKIFKKDGSLDKTCGSSCVYNFAFDGSVNIEITPNGTDFSIKKLTIKNFNNPNSSVYKIYLDDPLENTSTPINVRFWNQVSAFGLDFSNFENVEVKIEHNGGTGLYQCIGWSMSNSNCPGYWIRHQTINDLLENFTFKLSKTFITENVSLAFADSIISIQRFFPKFVAPRKEYNFSIELYNQMDISLTTLNLTEVITSEWFGKRNGKVKEVFSGTWSQKDKTAYFDLGDITSRETQFVIYKVKSAKLLKNENEKSFYPFNGTIRYVHLLTNKVVTSLGEITVKHTASPFFSIEPSRVNATKDYNYSFKMENVGSRLFSGNISLKIPSLCTINSVDDNGSNINNLLTWFNQSNVLPDTSKTFRFNMSCDYWNNLVLEASALGSDNDFNTIDVTQNIFVVIDDTVTPKINDITISPTTTTTDNTVTITANVTDDLEIRDVKSQIESPNSSIINYTMALFSGDNYVLDFDATGDDGIYLVKIYGVDKSFNINESSLYNFSISLSTSSVSEDSSGGGGGGSSGGGGGWSCRYKVECTGWSECIDGRQTRSCENVKVTQFYSATKCDYLKEAVTERECREGTCSDNIKNQDETGIDCGGSCGPCFTISIGNEEDEREVIEDNANEPRGNIITGAVVGAVEKLSANPLFLIGIVVIIVSGLLLSKYFIKKPSKLSEDETKKLHEILESEYLKKGKE